MVGGSGGQGGVGGRGAETPRGDRERELQVWGAQHHPSRLSLEPAAP